MVASLQKMFSSSSLIVFYCLFGANFLYVTGTEDGRHFTNEWAAEIPGGVQVAREVAAVHGFRVVRELPSFPHHYLLERSDTPHRSRRSARHHTRKLEKDERVIFAEQQQHLVRVKREFTDLKTARDITGHDIATRAFDLRDPEFKNQWYINKASVKEGRKETLVTDLRVRDVWEKGIFGKNIIITVIDDGLETTHDDLIDNYDPRASLDLNSGDNDPTPRYDPTNTNMHGTRCAGVIAMVANNNICGVGIAFNSKVGGIRLLDGKFTDTLEAQALSFKPQYVHIYSASWGPEDNGKTCAGPRALTGTAIMQGVEQGRGGKGSLYVWSSGNGGQKEDSCFADGYVSAVETISVSSATQKHKIPAYSEKCAAIITTAYSGGSFMESRVVSTDLLDECTKSHTGTSAATPMVSGILALLLEVNPSVTWRDVQHILAHTSRMKPLADNKGWYRNGAGYSVHLAFGFGLIDALAVVTLGDPKTWRSVGPQRICYVEPVTPSLLPLKFVSEQTVEVEFQTNGCAGTKNEINYLEHIQVVVDIDHPRRGRVYAEVQSAMSTVTPLLLERIKDDSEFGFKKWPLMSVHNWGEKPQGKWRFRVADRTKGKLTGVLKSATLVLYGTKDQPEYQKTSPKNRPL